MTNGNVSSEKLAVNKFSYIEGVRGEVPSRTSSFLPSTPPGEFALSEEKGDRLIFNQWIIPPITKLNSMRLFQKHERKEGALLRLRLKAGSASFKHIEPYVLRQRRK